MQQLAAAHESGRMPHAWLLRGAQGIGKRTLVDAFCASILPQPALLASGGHPDVLVLTPEEGKAIIAVEAARAAAVFARSTASLGGWRVIIVDSADDMNTAAANALLKTLEEPGSKTLLFLISHAAGRLLPTIRSRCVVLRCGSLSYEEYAAVLKAHDEEPDRDLYTLTAGSPGKALAYIRGGLSTPLQQAMRATDSIKELTLAERLKTVELLASSAKQHPELWQALAEAWLGWAQRQLKTAAVHGASYPAMAPRWQAYHEVRGLLAAAPTLHLDARSVLLSSLSMMRTISV